MISDGVWSSRSDIRLHASPRYRTSRTLLLCATGFPAPVFRQLVGDIGHHHTRPRKQLTTKYVCGVHMQRVLPTSGRDELWHDNGNGLVGLARIDDPLQILKQRLNEQPVRGIQYDQAGTLP